MGTRTLGVLGLVVGIAARASLAGEIDTLTTNIYNGALATPPTDTGVAGTLANLRADGSFSDVNYADTSVSNWQSPKHLNKLNEMVLAYANPSSTYYKSASLQASINSVYNYWLTKDPQNSNWFYNQISTPDKLGQAMVLMQQAGILPSTNLAKAISIVHRSATGQGGASQGANLASQAKCTVYEGVVRYRTPGASAAEQTAASNLIKTSYNYIGSTLAVVNDLEDDGIRADRSFQQHQALIQDASYGASLLGNVTTSAGWAAGTGYGLSAADAKNLIDYVLDGGPQWMVRGTTYDPLVGGRYWSRTGTTDAASALLGPVTSALNVSGGYRTAELTTLQARLADAKANQTASPTLGPTGNRAYWVSDYMVQQRPGYMMSVKFVSTRTNKAETINGENLKAGYGTAGVNLIFRTGREYDNIYPVWDWYRLPGTTGERSSTGTGGTYDLLPDHQPGTTAQNGGVSNGNVGAAIYTQSEYGITANKGYFFFDRGEVALGNSIKQLYFNGDGTGVVGTNVNQTLLNGNVVYSTAPGQAATIGSGQTVSPAGLRWVNHDSIGYFFFTPAANATIRTVQQTGNWDSINTAGALSTIRHNVFSLDLNHGSAPTAGSYLYAVVPNLAANQMDAYWATNPFTVLRNDNLAQAVTDNASGVTAINFFDRGTVTFADGVRLAQTNRYHGASVLWDPDGGSVTMSMANVDGYATGLFTFTVTQHLQGAGAVWNAATGLTTITFSPPTGSLGGSTVSRTFTIVPIPEPATALALVGAACARGLARGRRRRRPDPESIA